jgi:hypothetical protein
MSLSNRLRRIEDGLAGAGCSACAVWPPRVVYVGGDPVEEDGPAVPARCSRCGREPLTIRVEYGEWPHPAA